MIVKTMVAVKSRGKDPLRWVDYLNEKYVKNGRECPEPLMMGDKSSRKNSGNGPWYRLISLIAMDTGVMRQTVIAPLTRMSFKEMISRTELVIRKFNYMTGRDGIVSVLAYHADAPVPHVHILQASTRKSQLYYNIKDLELFKLIAVEAFREPIGKIAYIKRLDNMIIKEKNMEKIEKLKRERKRALKVHENLQRHIGQEIRNMAR